VCGVIEAGASMDVFLDEAGTSMDDGFHFIPNISYLKKSINQVNKKMDFYRRNLPHWQPKGAEFFITFRLAGTLPKKVILELKEKRRQLMLLDKNSGISSGIISNHELKIFETYNHLLDNETTGPTWLSNKEVAEIVKESFHFFDQECYDLYAYTVMSNHVHLVFRHLEESHDVEFPVTDLMKRIKSFTGKNANQILGRKGKFWQSESYDRVIRDETELENVIKYTIYNPVKAGLVSDWKKWPHTYCKQEFIECL
jgi:putative transposase